jgi:RimJ/RimL family protein N-acetyltransferase
VKRTGLDDIDIGYAFLPLYTGQGYAFESTAAVLNHCRNSLKLKRVVAITNPVNVRSIALLQVYV